MARRTISHAIQMAVAGQILLAPRQDPDQTRLVPLKMITPVLVLPDLLTTHLAYFFNGLWLIAMLVWHGPEYFYLYCTTAFTFAKLVFVGGNLADLAKLRKEAAASIR